MYKNSTRKQIQDWLNVVGNKKNQDWIIIHSAEKPKRIFNMGPATSVYDKMKSDFGVKKDHFFHIPVSSTEPKSLEAWNELIKRIKEAVICGITSQIVQYDEDARRLEQQRLIPGWNYNQYFNLKEALADTFEILTLFRQSLVQYDEMEASFYQTLEEQGAPWFKKFGATEVCDDNPDIFHLSLKDYRNRISQNSISIYDFRMYLFSRQCCLLNVLQKAPEICDRAKMFISAFSKTLSDYTGSLTPYFREIWTYSLTLNILRHCDELMAISVYSLKDGMLYEGLKGELTVLARYQLDRLGVFAKMLSHTFHCSIKAPLDLDITTPDDSQIQTTNEELEFTLKSKSSFDSMYVSLTEKALISFEKCKRKSTVSSLKSDLAFLYFIRQNYTKASSLFKEVCFAYGIKGWDIIDIVLIERYAICLRQLKETSDLTKCYLQLVLFPQYLELESHSFYFDQLKISSMEDKFIAPESRLFTILGIELVEGLKSGALLKAIVTIENHLPLPFDFDEIKVTLKGKILMTPSVQNITLKPGVQKILLTCPKTLVPGDYFASDISLYYGKLEFHYLLKEGLKVIIYQELEALSIVLHRVESDSIILLVSSNETTLSNATMTLTPLTSTSSLSIPSQLEGLSLAPNSTLKVPFPFTSKTILDHKVLLTIQDCSFIIKLATNFNAHKRTLEALKDCRIDKIVVAHKQTICLPSQDIIQYSLLQSDLKTVVLNRLLQALIDFKVEGAYGRLKGEVVKICILDNLIYYRSVELVPLSPSSILRLMPLVKDEERQKVLEAVLSIDYRVTMDQILELPLTSELQLEKEELQVSPLLSLRWDLVDEEVFKERVFVGQVIPLKLTIKPLTESELSFKVTVVGSDVAIGGKTNAMVLMKNHEEVLTYALCSLKSGPFSYPSIKIDGIPFEGPLTHTRHKVFNRSEPYSTTFSD